MPALETKFEDIVYDPKVQSYCNNPNFKCPNYGHSWACPPEAPYLEQEVSTFKRFYLIYVEFDLAAYIKQEKLKHPKKSEIQIKNSFYRKSPLRLLLEQEIMDFVAKAEGTYTEKLILWDGHCTVCYSKDKKACTYDDGQPCRYPDLMRISLEASGIDVNATVKKVNINLEWPPTTRAYRFGLVCFK